MSIRAESVKRVEGNIGKNSGDLGFNSNKKQEIYFFNWTSSKLKAFSLQDTVNDRKMPHTWKNVCKIIYSRRDL